MKTQRTDTHRPSVILPSEYACRLNYSLPSSSGGMRMPGIGVDCERDFSHVGTDGKWAPGTHAPGLKCCIKGYEMSGEKFADVGRTGKCSICGARFLHGDVWLHVPSGEHIHVGHDCAEKYELLADRSEWEMKNRRLRAAALVMASRHSREGKFLRFCNGHEGLKEAFETDHSIIADIKSRLLDYGAISPKQVALVMKLATEAKNPPAAEQHVEAPTGKQTFSGRVVSVKCIEGIYGTQIKMTVKVETPAGSWLAWGTAPAACLSESVNHGGLKGCEVEVTATLKAGRDKHFAVMSRPRGKVQKLACSGDCAGCRLDSLRHCPAPQPTDLGSFDAVG